MAVIPDGRVDKIEFCETRAAPWAANAAAIGTTSAAVADLAAKTTAARAAYAAQQAAQSAARNATADYHIAVAEMASAAQAIVDQVRIKAVTAGDGVYSLASIPAPASPSPIGPLGMPSDFTVELDQRGALNLKWKCSNPESARGTVYQIWRRIGGEGEFVSRGFVGVKKYTDASVPPGSAQVEYQIQAIRSTSVGPMARFVVNFGMGRATPARLAA